MSISKSFLLLLALVVGGCSQEESTPTHPIVSGTSNKFFTARSEREIFSLRREQQYCRSQAKTASPLATS